MFPVCASLNLLQCGDCYFFARSYSRQTRHLSPVPASPMCTAVKEDVQALLEMQATHGLPGRGEEEDGPRVGGEPALRHRRLNDGSVFPDISDRSCAAQPR